MAGCGFCRQIADVFRACGLPFDPSALVRIGNSLDWMLCGDERGQARNRKDRLPQTPGLLGFEHRRGRRLEGIELRQIQVRRVGRRFPRQTLRSGLKCAVDNKLN